jgi:hypothetical protein
VWLTSHARPSQQAVTAQLSPALVHGCGALTHFLVASQDRPLQQVAVEQSAPSDAHTGAGVTQRFEPSHERAAQQVAVEQSLPMGTQAGAGFTHFCVASHERPAQQSDDALQAPPSTAHTLAPASLLLIVLPEPPQPATQSSDKRTIRWLLHIRVPNAAPRRFFPPP